MKEHYRHFIFDLYGTLADIRTDETLPKVRQAVSEFLAERGIRCTPDEFREAYPRLCAALQCQKDVELRAAGTAGPAEIDILKVWDALASERGGCLTLTEKQDLSALFRKQSTCRLRLFPGAEEVLQTLGNAGKTVCLLTNAQESFTLPELRELGLLNYFRFIFISSREGVKKPSPAFFALPSAAGLCPEESLMIGNDDRCDCHGAAAAGMDSLYIHTEQSPGLPGPLPENCTVIRQLTDILQYI